eukprot:TRINITY_DN49420_c0_g1_i1.p1 TRINITY_DN49420_c0_g1~~TRINITY_DN49420_c0_g1_i1.p1  ORF type:complete len:468 (-),score=100.68 TRINITY_DN49420_c0_g1_i1:69-1472(-)
MFAGSAESYDDKHVEKPEVQAFHRQLLCNEIALHTLDRYADGGRLGRRVQVTTFIIEALREAWDVGLQTQIFCDLQCGDGKAVLDVCRAFPGCSGIGWDVDRSLVKWAQAQAEQCGLQGRCEFRVRGGVQVNLSSASALLLDMPAAALNFLLKRVLPRSKLQPSTLVFVVGKPLPCHGSQMYLQQGSPNANSESGIFLYAWADISGSTGALKSSQSLPSLKTSSPASQQIPRDDLVHLCERMLQKQVLQQGFSLTPPTPADRASTEAWGLGSPSRKNRQRDGQSLLLPRGTHNLLCNWSPVEEAKLAALIRVLALLWEGHSKSQVFFDLGCGDGRVVVDVCSSLANCRGVGVDLNEKLVEKAASRARAKGLQERCNFKAADMVGVDLSEASAIFLYLPVAALTFVMKHVLPGSGLAKGTLIFSSDGPLPASNQIQALNWKALGFSDRRSKWIERTENVGLFCYSWLG